MYRRHLLTSALPFVLVGAGTATLLVGCQPAPIGSGTTVTVPTLTTVLAYAAAIESLLAGANGAPGLLQTISQLSPATITPAQLAVLLIDMKTAAGLLNGIAASGAPTVGATTLQQVEAYFNDAMAFLSGIVICANARRLSAGNRCGDDRHRADRGLHQHDNRRIDCRGWCAAGGNRSGIGRSDDPHRDVRRNRARPPALHA